MQIWHLVVGEVEGGSPRKGIPVPWEGQLTFNHHWLARRQGYGTVPSQPLSPHQADDFNSFTSNGVTAFSGRTPRYYSCKNSFPDFSSHTRLIQASPELWSDSGSGLCPAQRSLASAVCICLQAPCNPGSVWDTSRTAAWDSSSNPSIDLVPENQLCEFMLCICTFLPVVFTFFFLFCITLPFSLTSLFLHTFHFFFLPRTLASSTFFFFFHWNSYFKIPA